MPPRLIPGPVREGKLTPSVGRPFSTEPRPESPALPGPGVVAPALARVDDIEGIAPPPTVPALFPILAPDAEVSFRRLVSWPDVAPEVPAEAPPDVTAAERGLAELVAVGVETPDKVDLSRFREEERT